MTSNMTMTAISICDFLKLIVKSTVEHYTEKDFKLDIKIFKRYAKRSAGNWKVRIDALVLPLFVERISALRKMRTRKILPCSSRSNTMMSRKRKKPGPLRLFLVTVTGMEGQKPVGYITPINYADECDRIRRYAVPAEKGRACL